MPSTRITDCVTPLAWAWFEIKREYEEAHPGATLILTCTKRSREEQAALYRVGRVERNGKWVVDADPTTQIVTQLDGDTKLSKHNLDLAEAIDVCVVIGGKASWDPAQYAPLGPLARKYGLVWGGDWKMKDYPHIEMPNAA